MRWYLNALMLCTVLAFFSFLYVFSQLASSLEARDEWALRKSQRISDGSGHDAGYFVRKGAGAAGLREGFDR